MNSVCHTEHKDMNLYVTLQPHLVLRGLGLKLGYCYGFSGRV